MTLRALGRSELPRLVELLDVWDVVRWLTVVPFPYTMRDAETFFSDIEPLYACGEPQFYALSLKDDRALIGGLGLHSPRYPTGVEGEVEMGYWLGKDYWGRGLMSEAARLGVEFGFARPATRAIGATTVVSNRASQNVLCKAGLRNLGVFPRPYKALRGSDEVVKWLLTREEWEERNHSLR